jgi:CSLREA domain-containing protein
LDSHASRRAPLIVFLAAVLCTFGLAASAHAATTYNVNTTADHADGTCDATDCSLRDAVEASNSDGDDSIVNLPAGHYTLDPTQPGLHIFGDGAFTLTGAGARSTIIDGGGGPVGIGTTITTNDTVFTLEGSCKCPSAANATITGVTVTGGNPDQRGGAFWVRNFGPAQLATLHLYDSTVTGNSTESDGAGIFNEGVVDVQRVTFNHNFAQADGAAIATKSFDESDAPARGLIAPNFATTSIVNSTFTDNHSDSDIGCEGGGAVEQQGGQTTIVNSTIIGNASENGVCEPVQPTGGGIDSEAGDIKVVNTIVTGNTAAPNGEEIASALTQRGGVSGPVQASNCSANPVTKGNEGTITSLGNNIESGTDCGFTASGDQQNVADPKVGPLANNGGQMDTMALLTGSPAIDRANSANCPATDEIGTTRPQGPACDVGAYEVPVPPPPAPPATPPAKPAAPKVGVAGVRRACVSSSFHIRFHVATSASVKSVVVKLDGKKIKSTSRASFTLTINGKKLSSGRHRLTITATDSAGQTTTTHKSFSVCAAAKPKRKTAPRFTG